MSAIVYQDRDAVIAAQREEREKNEIEALKEQIMSLREELSVKQIAFVRETLGGPIEPKAPEATEQD